MLLSDSAAPPSWHVERLPATELPVLVLSQELATFLPEQLGGPSASSVARRTRQHLEQEVLPEFLRPRSWFARHNGALGATRLGPAALWRNEHRTFLLSFVDADIGGTHQRYFLPLALAWEDAQDSGALRTVEWTLAKVREHARVGVLIDAFADPSFCLGIAHCTVANANVPFAGGELQFRSTGDVPALAEVRGQSTNHLGADSTNTSVILDEKVFLKAYRRAEAGTNPDVEMTSFLTRAGYRSIAPLAGSVAHAAEQSTVLAALFAAVGHQGDVFNYTLNHLERYATTMFTAQGASASDSPHALFVAQMHTLGRRIGQMHCVLASADRDDPAFASEELKSADQARWYSAIHFEAHSLLRRARAPAVAGRATGAGGAESARERRAAACAHSRAVQRIDCRLEAATSRQSAPRQSLVGRRRLSDHGIRRRRIAAARRTTQQGLAIARCRNRVALVRLRAGECAGARRHGSSRSARAVGAGAGRLVTANHGVLPEGLSARRRRIELCPR